MNTLQTLIDFLERLEENKIHYNLGKIRDSILVEVAVPGQRWEVEFFPDGIVDVEKFLSDGTIFDKSEIEVLFRDFSD
ncbi:MAG: hypothetical protein FWC69_02295 [Defluviitaleaceae bacterium]|nr:hypothetical protein [Defluviitaleaceae bacterium]